MALIPKHVPPNFGLDVESLALKGGESGKPAIVPGKPDESELIRRIFSQDSETVMPPPEHRNHFRKTNRHVAKMDH